MSSSDGSLNDSSTSIVVDCARVDPGSAIVVGDASSFFLEEDFRRGLDANQPSSLERSRKDRRTIFRRGSRSSQPRVYEVRSMQLTRPTRHCRQRLSLGEAHQQTHIREEPARRGGSGALRTVAVPHGSSQVVGGDAAVVDGRTERGEIARSRLGDRRRRGDDAFNGHLSRRRRI